MSSDSEGLRSEETVPQAIVVHEEKPEAKKILTGTIEVAEMNDAEFESLRLAFGRPAKKKFKSSLPRQPVGDPSDVNGYRGPWAPRETGEGDEMLSGPSEEEKLVHTRQLEAKIEPQREQNIEPGQERTILHQQQERDYLGRTYMHVPLDLDVRLDKEVGSVECYAPKKIIHTWTGHSKGVNAIRFFPTSGHMLLSASQDCRIKLWDVYRSKKCLRTFLGHNKPVRDICFNNSGTEFASCAFDSYIKHWDTETGKCISYIKHTDIPFCVRIHPDPDKQNVVLAACADKKIMQWDLRSGDVIQEYNQHLDAVNSITFFDNNKKFVSSSDDKTLRVWEYDIPVTAKYIADPSMHSMPQSALHPDGNFIAFQSMNNQVVIYSVSENKFTERKKRFTGHSSAGFACQVGFSPDGKYLISGDTRGHLVVWDWRNGQMVRKLSGHTQVCIGFEWHPQESSKVATCSWDGSIKLWD